MKKIERIARDWMMNRIEEGEANNYPVGASLGLYQYMDGIRKGIELVQELEHWAFDEGGSDYISAMEIGLLKLSLEEEEILT